MKPDGRAVLILGGKLGSSQDIRSDKYNTRESRGFYWTLYKHYNVTNHFTIDGNLYRKQGAGFPIDVIVIDHNRVPQRSRLVDAGLSLFAVRQIYPSVLSRV
jgi:hypothetical protein